MPDEKLIAELSMLYDTANKVRNMLEDAGIDLAKVRPPFGEMTAYEYWRYILNEVNKGLINDGPERLKAVLGKDFPYNTLFVSASGTGSNTRKAPNGGTGTGNYDVFFSYNSKDRAVVQYIACELEKQGYRAWMDEDALQGGERIMEALEQALLTIKYIAIFIGQHGPGPWQQQEIAVAVDLHAAHKIKMIPVLLYGADSSALSPFLRQVKAISCKTKLCDWTALTIADILNLKTEPYDR